MKFDEAAMKVVVPHQQFFVVALQATKLYIGVAIKNGAQYWPLLKL